MERYPTGQMRLVGFFVYCYLIESTETFLQAIVSMRWGVDSREVRSGVDLICSGTFSKTFRAECVCLRTVALESDRWGPHI